MKQMNMWMCITGKYNQFFLFCELHATLYVDTLPFNTWLVFSLSISELKSTCYLQDDHHPQNLIEPSLSLKFIGELRRPLPCLRHTIVLYSVLPLILHTFNHLLSSSQDLLCILPLHKLHHLQALFAPRHPLIE